MSINGENPLVNGSGSVNRLEFTATAGQTNFPLETTLNTTSAIFVNGTLISNSEWSGETTETLILAAVSFIGDIVTVII
ncbi:MAG: hypothetical protein DRP93_01425 [Candidatus Neomarinimicrobiota bacterium]|nr:MAG: hypothetical protein DRP93_01425 [Candidatus Neomarinimicrobiota bacterium]